MTVGTAFFNYCPSCCSTNFEYTNNFKFCCKDCDFVLYHNIAAAVALVFIFEEKILFTVRNVNPDKGKLDLPGGFIDPGETAERFGALRGRGLESTNFQFSTNVAKPFFYLLIYTFQANKKWFLRNRSTKVEFST